MRIAVTCLVGAAFAVALVGCQDPGRPIASSQALEKAGLQYYWKAGVKLDKGEHVAKMWHLDENVYFLTSSNRLVCFDAARGVQLWSYQVAGAGQTVFSPCHAKSLTITREVPGALEILGSGKAGKEVTFKPVMINTLDRLIVLDRTSGELMRNIKLDFVANTSGDADPKFSANNTGASAKYFYVGDTNGRYHAVDIQAAISLSARSAGALLKAPPVLYNGSVYVGSSDGKIFVADTLRWSGPNVVARQLGGGINVPMTVNDLGWFVSCEDNRLYALDTVTGKTRAGWSDPFPVKGQLRNAAQVGRKTVYQLSEGDRFYAINVANGQKRWESRSGMAVLGIFDTTVCLLDKSNNLQLVDEIVGNVKAQIPMGYELYVANAVSPVLYVAKRNGQAACIAPLSAGQLTLEKFSSSQPAP